MTSQMVVKKFPSLMVEEMSVRMVVLIPLLNEGDSAGDGSGSVAEQAGVEGVVSHPNSSNASNKSIIFTLKPTPKDTK